MLFRSLQQRQLVEATRGQLIQANAALEVLFNELAILVGATPDRLDMAIPDSLPAVPPIPTAGLPADVIRRRPDVKAAELTIQAADRQLAAAIANQFPKLSIAASASTDADEVPALFDDWLAALAANLAAPVIDGGQRKAQVGRARAARSEQINAYGQTLLTALAEVENALTLETHQRQYLRSLDAQLALSAAAVEQTRDYYLKGTADFTRYLTSQLSHQSLQQTVLAARRQQLAYRVELYKALGGQWPMTPPPQATLDTPLGDIDDNTY